MFMGLSYKRSSIFFIAIACVLCFPLAYTTICDLKLRVYEEELTPYTDNFLLLMVNNDYVQLYKNYANDSRMTLDDFKQQVKKMHSTFGRIKAYRYRGFSSSYAGIFGKLLGFVMYYDLDFDDKKARQGNFSIEIDKDTHMPRIGKILTFNISSDFGKRLFYLRLIRYGKGKM
jgi:hypothetical protein